MRRGENIYVDLCIFVWLKLHHFTNFVNNLKFNDFFKNKKNKKQNTLTVKIFYNLQGHPTFHSEERLATKNIY